MAKRASEKVVDSKTEYVTLNDSMLLDNIINMQFEENEWKIGLDFVAKYCAMYVGFINCGIDEDSCVELVKTIIEKDCKERV